MSKQFVIKDPNKPATYPQKVLLHRIGLGENKKFGQWTMTKGQASELIQAHKAEQNGGKALNNLGLTQPASMANVLAMSKKSKKTAVNVISAEQVASVIYQLAMKGIAVK